MSSDESRDGLIASGLGHRRRRIPERSGRFEDLKAKKTSNVCDATAQCATAINCSLHHLKIVLNNYEQLLFCCGAIREVHLSLFPFHHGCEKCCKGSRTVIGDFLLTHSSA